VVERDVAVATVRAFAERSGAERVVLLLDEGPGAPTLIELTSAGLEVVAEARTHDLDGLIAAVGSLASR